MLMKYRLYTPGPTSVPEATLLELAKPVHHHRTGEFRTMFAEIQSALQYVYQTKQIISRYIKRTAKTAQRFYGRHTRSDLEVSDGAGWNSSSSP